MGYNCYGVSTYCSYYYDGDICEVLLICLISFYLLWVAHSLSFAFGEPKKIIKQDMMIDLMPQRFAVAQIGLSEFINCLQIKY